MKKILLSAAVLALTATAFAQKTVADVAKFASETINFGKIKQGVPQKGTFTVTNIGTEPLIIEQANPTCGCTISDYTKEPIAPGKTGVINATYNAANTGSFTKHLTVKFAGVNEMKSITFTGEVVPSEVADKAKVEEMEKIKAEDKAKKASEPVAVVKDEAVKATPLSGTKATTLKKATTPRKPVKAKKLVKKA